MVFSSKIESLAQRFAPYIDELQDFFSSRKVPFGTLADLQAFPGRLRDDSFREEMVSMVRSILYRENEGLPRTELMDLLAIAVGGPHFEEAAPELQETLHELMVFVTEVVRSQRVTHPADFSAEDETPLTAPGPVTAPLSPADPLQLWVNEDPPVVPVSVPTQRLESLPSAPARDVPAATNDRLSRALMGAEPETTANAVNESVLAAAAEVPERRQPAAETPRFSANRAEIPPRYSASRRSVSSFLRRAYWIPGLLVLLLVLGVAYSLRSRSQPQAAEPAAPISVAANPQLPKPSAYGPAMNATGGPRTSSQEAVSGRGPATLPADQGGSGSFAAENHPAARASSDRSLSASSRHMDSRPTLSSSSVTPRVLGGREGVFLASSGMMAAHLLAAPAPHYPKLASITHVEGEVIVQVVVARDGRVEATRVLEGPRLLRSAAEHAIRHWRYRPYLVDGKPTDVATIVTVNFRLSR